MTLKLVGKAFRGQQYKHWCEDCGYRYEDACNEAPRHLD